MNNNIYNNSLKNSLNNNLKENKLQKTSEELPKTVLITESNSSISSNNDEINSKKINNIRFIFYDNNHIDYDIDSIKAISSTFYNNIIKKYKNNNQKKKKKIEILIPNNIPKNSFFDFLFLIKNGYNEIEEYTTEKLIKLLMLSDFFQNEKINVNLINDLIINKINSQNSFDFLVYSYNKLNNYNNNNNNNNFEYENVYFELFYKCLDKIGQDEKIVIKNLNKLKTIDKKLSIEIVQKTFSHLIFSNYVYSNNENSNKNILSEENNNNYFQTTSNNNNNEEILKTEENPIHKIIINNNKNTISENSLNNLIKSLFDIYNTKNFFDLLTLEYMKIFSSENLNELEQQPNPNFQIRISIYEYENYYEEYPIDIIINNKSVFFVLFYKISDDSFNVCIKLSDKKNNNNNKNDFNEENFCFKIFSFLTIVNIPNQSNDFSLLNQSTLKNLCNNKSMHTIFKLTNFSHFIKTNFYNNNNNNNLNNNNNNNILNEEDSFLLQIRIKLCQIYTVLTNYLLKNFNNLYFNENFYKISKQLLIIILKHKNLSKRNENEIVLAIINWINNEINIKEDVTELFDFINWNEVDDNLIFELVIKYNNFIIGNDYIENMFKNIFIQKFNKNNININDNNNVYFANLIKNFFLAAKKIDFSNVFVNMKKNEKFNFLYKNNNNSFINLNSNNNLNINNNNNNNKSSYKKNPLNIHQLNFDNSFHLNNNNNSNNNYNNINNSININNNSFILNNNNNNNNKNNFEKTFNNLSNNLKGESFNFLNNLTYNNYSINNNNNNNFYDNNNNNNNNKNRINNLKKKSFSNKNIFKNNLNNNNSKKNNNKNENSFTKINKFIINNNNNNSNKINTNFSSNSNEKSQIINLLIKKNIEPITFKNTLNLNSNKNFFHEKINNNNNNNKKNDSLIKIKNNSKNKKIIHTRNKSNHIFNNNSKSNNTKNSIKIEDEKKTFSNLMKNKHKKNNNFIINKSFNAINNNKNYINNN